MLWLQAASCLPLWIVLAMVLSLVKAAASRTPSQRKRWLQWAAVSGVALATSLFWANPHQMIHDSGPFSGSVVDAQTKEPVPVALLVYTWGGQLGVASSHSAWTTTTATGGYRMAWQGFGNWRFGAWPGPDSFYVLAPGYAGAQFFLDGKQRDPYGNYDANARSATREYGQIRLQRLQPDTKFNIGNLVVLFGIGARDERLRVANRFYDETYPRLCAQSGQRAEWAATDFGFHQLYQLVMLINPDFYKSAMRDGNPEGRFVVETLNGVIRGNGIPRLLDAPTVQRLCTGLKLPEREHS